MKFITTNFVQCAVKACGRSSNSFPLRYSGLELVKQEIDMDPEFVVSMLAKIDWEALRKVAADLGNNGLPLEKPVIQELDLNNAEQLALLSELHSLLFETVIKEGQMTCENCGHIYHIKEFIPNMLLPPQLA